MLTSSVSLRFINASSSALFMLAHTTNVVHGKHLGLFRKNMLQALFDKFDSNRDGRFGKGEFAKMSYSMGHYLSDYELEVAFALIDSNGSGYIERNEFERFWRTDARFDKVRLDDAQLVKMQQSMLNLIHTYNS